MIAVRTPGWDKPQQAWALEDLAILTGGRAFVQVAGDTFHSIRPRDFGRARRAWADLRTFGFVGGKGSPRALRQHIATLRDMFDQTDDTVLRGELLQRIGKLMGGSATLWIGGATEFEITTRQEVAERTAAAMRAAMMEGVVPGGGVALLACRPALQGMLASSDGPDERAAYRILIRALAEPFRTIVDNAGYDASDAMAEVRLAGPGHGFDATAGRVVDMMQTGIYDPAIVLKSAAYGAVTTAALALTVDVLVHPERATRAGQACTYQPRERSYDGYDRTGRTPGCDSCPGCFAGLAHLPRCSALRTVPVSGWRSHLARRLWFIEPTSPPAHGGGGPFARLCNRPDRVCRGTRRNPTFGRRWPCLDRRPIALPPPFVHSLAVSPQFAQDGVVLAGTMEDGVFRSGDRGAQWAAWNFGLLDLSVLCLSMSPAYADDETVFAGTDSGIFRSMNGGRAWRELEFPPDWAPVLSLALSPGFGADGMLFAGTEFGGHVWVE